MSELRFKKLIPEAVLPSRANEGDAGLDLVAAESGLIEPNTQKIIDTGLMMAVPEGHAGLITPRSGNAAKSGITVTNSPGVIDAGYRGPVKVILRNTSLSREFIVKKGDRIAQLLIVPVSILEPVLVDDLDDDTERGAGGFGSSGS